MLRTVMATIGGVVVAIVIVMIVEAVGHSIYPPPADIDISDLGELAKVIKNMPKAALSFVVAAWVFGAAGGAAAGTWLSPARSILPALIVGIFITFGVFYSLYAIPHPLWMMITGIALPLPAALISRRLLG